MSDAVSIRRDPKTGTEDGISDKDDAGTNN